MQYVLSYQMFLTSSPFLSLSLPPSLPIPVTVTAGFEEVVYSQQESLDGVLVCAEIKTPAVAEREFFLLLSSSDRDASKQNLSIFQPLLGPDSVCSIVRWLDLREASLYYNYLCLDQWLL